MKHAMKSLVPVLSLSALALCGACSGGSGSSGAAAASGMGHVEIQATDAFLAHSQVEEARIEVSRIELHDDAGGHGWVTVHAGAPIAMDLVSLRNGVVQTLAAADLPAGQYRQVRLVFDDAYLELVNENEYSTALGNLSLTSQATSGLKVFVEPPLLVVDGVSERVLLDFDLTKTFLPIPANDPLNAPSYKLLPVIHASNLSQTGELRGHVTRDDGFGNQQPVAGASVYVLPPGEPDKEDAITTTATESDGRYAVLGLLPGTYDVLAEEGGGAGRVDGVAVQLGAVTGVDVELQGPAPLAAPDVLARWRLILVR